jgi:hypothetical protein
MYWQPGFSGSGGGSSSSPSQPPKREKESITHPITARGSTPPPKETIIESTPEPNEQATITTIINIGEKALELGVVIRVEIISTNQNE